MKVEQISIFLENRTGRLQEVAKILAEAQINIKALSLADTSDFGILRLIVSDNDKAKEVLRQNGFTVGKTNVVAVEVEDKPGGLYSILSLLSEHQVNVEYMYAFVQQTQKNAVLIFRFDKTDQAIQILQKNKIKIISAEELSNM